MNEKNGFTHITIEPEDDEELVFAGSYAPSPEEGHFPFSSEEARVEPGCEGAGFSEDPSPAPERIPESTEAALPASESPAKKSEGYRPTTLEDLRPEPMPLMQKVIIIAAAVFLVAAGVYYFCFIA